MKRFLFFLFLLILIIFLKNSVAIQVTGYAVSPPTVQPAISVSISPKSVDMIPSQTQEFIATVSGTSNTDVTWSTSCGSLTSITSNPTTYIAQQDTPTTCTITATSLADSKQSDTATINMLKTCLDECSNQGITQCSSKGLGYQTCGDYNLDGCLEWSLITSCNAEETCNNGACRASTSCTDECVLNTRICSGNGYQICGNYDSDSCTEYSFVTPCTQNQICSNGICSGTSVTQSKCSDNTDYNKCSSSQPRYCDNGVLIDKCNLCGCSNNGQCLADGSCIVVTQGIASDDQSLLDKPPKISFMPEISLVKDQTNTNNLLNLNNYAIDPESQEIIFTFLNNKLNFNSDIIDCYLIGPILNCSPPKKSGKVSISIIASDGIKSSTSKFYINVIQSEIPEVEGRKLENIPPVADAGPDKIVPIGSLILLDASKSYDLDNDLPNLPDNYIWVEDNLEIGRGINLKLTLPEGVYRITLKVVDANGLSSTDHVLVYVKPKSTCLNTKTLYSPIDTICNNKWPSTEGEIVNINNLDYSCNLVEVCDENLDYIIKDTIDCCDGTPLTDTKKINSCSFANKYSSNNIKRCEGLYLIKSLGADAIYMQDYFEAEMCCYGVKELCSNNLNLYSAEPLPRTETTQILTNNLKCFNNPKNNIPGKWLSDTRIDKNNIALNDAPAHVSLNILSTGTCVDYSFSLTTLLRKSGYLEDEVYSVEAPNHAYNLVKLPLDRKYTLVDTTGNNEPPIVLGKTPLSYDYCENIKRCYNDNGEAICPSLKDIYGCENKKVNLVKLSEREGYKALNIVKTIKNLFEREIKE